MTAIVISPEDLKAPTTWEVNGQSPSNSPMAIMQAASQLMEWAQDPETGLDKYEITRRLIAAGPLGNDNIQLSKDDLANKLTALSQPQALLGAPGMDGAPGLPLAPAGGGNPAMPNVGPDQGPLGPA